MNRSHLRALPSLATSPEDAAKAQAELAGLFADLLARAEKEEESPAYELLEAAVDGTLDPVESAIFASRLAGDPALQREFDDLVALRDRLGDRLGDRLPRAPASQKSGARVPAVRRWLGVAAAAALVAALGLGLRMDLRRTDSTVAQEARTSQPARSAQLSLALPSSRSSAAAQSGTTVLFADSFEGGSAEHWSN